MTDSSAPLTPGQIAPKASETARRRLVRYLASFGDDLDDPRRRRYPGLPPGDDPWFSSFAFPGAATLEENFQRIAEEILGQDQTVFHEEQEREYIDRRGSWDVLFLFERGRFVTENCRRLPFLMSVINRLPYLPGHEGMIYVSRLRPGAFIGGHRGPTNLRARCHLPIVVPAGDCAFDGGGTGSTVGRREVSALRRLP